MKAIIVLAVLVAVAAADYYYNVSKSNTAKAKAQVEDTVGSKMSAATQVADEAVEAVETYHSEHPL